MSIIKLKEANCKNCYKCIRECPVKSIAFKNEQAQIISDECILCGNCLHACPQHAKEVGSNLNKVKEFVAAKKKVYVSLAPSFPVYFKDATIEQMSFALKKLGFTQIEETAIGAAKVSRQYDILIKEHKLRNIITTACPSTVLLIEKYFPSLVEYLAPVASPMIAHARAMKEVYNTRIKVVFIGPCIAKKHEVEDITNEGMVYEALTFEELEQWFREENITLEEGDDKSKGVISRVARFYPVPGGIIKTIPKESRKLYKCVAIDGIERCISVLKQMEKEEVNGYFIEMNACEGACISGPSLKDACFLNGRDSLILSANSKVDGSHYVSDEFEPNIRKTYIDKSAKNLQPTEEEIRAILKNIGKYTKEDELNCGGCGYNTCKDKAVAVFNGKAEAEMCLPFVRQKAESMSNLIISSSPNAIIALNKELIITEVNPSVCELLKRGENQLIGERIEKVLMSDMYYKEEGDGDIKKGQVEYPEYNITVEQTVVFARDSIILIIKDITKEAEQFLKNAQLRSEAIAVTDKVIAKQMRVAQEIASLLGETTAETKVALTRLRNTLKGEK